MFATVPAESRSRKEGEGLADLEISAAQYTALIDEWIVGRNAERNRKILKRRLIDGIAFEPLAEEFDLSDRQVKTIVYKAMNVLIKHI